MFYLSSTIAMHQLKKHQMMDHHSNTTHQLQRYRRWFTFFDNRDSSKQYQAGNNSPLVVNDIDSSGTSTTKDLLENLEHHTNRILEGATNTVLTPFNWLSHITRYW